MGGSLVQLERRVDVCPLPQVLRGSTFCLCEPWTRGSIAVPVDLGYYHALNNRYLVAPFDSCLSVDHIIQFCHLHRAEGVLCGAALHRGEVFLRIWNPDGSEAEMSGNGVRIFARALLDEGIWDRRGGIIATAGATVACGFTAQGTVVAEMALPVVEGTARSLATPVDTVIGFAATLGNPHFAIPVGQFPRDWRHRAAAITTHPHFPNRTNVQFLRVLDRRTIALRIWERGVGETASCGSGAASCAAIAHRHLGCDSRVRVRMAGGTLHITLTGSTLRILGPVTRIF
jgi:diaminopimelate epimerase